MAPGVTEKLKQKVDELQKERKELEEKLQMTEQESKVKRNDTFYSKKARRGFGRGDALAQWEGSGLVIGRSRVRKQVDAL